MPDQTSSEGVVAHAPSAKEAALELESSCGSFRDRHHLGKKEVVLHAQVMTARQHRPMQVVLTFMLVLSLLAFIYAMIYKTKQKQEKFFQDAYVQKANLLFGSFCLFALTWMLAAFLRNLVLVARDRTLFWTHRKRFAVALAFLQLLFQFINMIFFVAPNVYTIMHACGWFDDFVYDSTFIRWSCWATIFLLMSIHAHNISPWLNSDGSYKRGRQGSVNGDNTALIIADSAWWIHLPKLVIWVVFELAIIMLASLYPDKLDFQVGSPPEQASLPCTKRTYKCRTGLPYKIWTSIWILMLYLFVFVIISYSRQARRRLRQQPYNAYVDSQMMAIWMKKQIWMVSVLGASTVPLLWFTRWNSCNNYFMSWLGLLPLQMIVTTTTTVNAYYFLPVRPGEEGVLQEWLQDFAWDEASIAKQLKRRAEKTSNADIAQKLQAEPLFCFETAVKMLLWSELVYTHNELPPARKEALNSCCSWLPCLPKRTKGSPEDTDAEDISPIKLASAADLASTGHESGLTIPSLLPASPAQVAIKAVAPEVHSGVAASADQAQAKENMGEKEGFTAIPIAVESVPGKCGSDSGSSSFNDLKKGSHERHHSAGKSEKEACVSCEELLQSAMEMYGLENLKVVHEELLETRVLVAWSGSTLVLSFRGTAAMANVISDAKAWRTCHLPKRGRFLFGTRPMVHLGFYQSWLVNGLNARILQLVKDVLAEAKVPASEFRVYLTGHSLGGALATLAAFDIQEALKLPRLQVYTFGAPRTGNHAFAREYGNCVPHTWHVINDRDAVPRSGKFLTMYKRPGQRVLINNVGDLRVRPSALEVCMHTRGFSVSQHYLAAYLGALASICTTQCMRHKALPGGRSGVQRLASSHQVCTYLATSGLDLEDLLQQPPEEVCLPHLRPNESNKQRRWGLLWLLQVFAEEMLPAGENAMATLTMMGDDGSDAEEQARQPLQSRMSALIRRSSIPRQATYGSTVGSTAALQAEEV